MSQWVCAISTKLWLPEAAAFDAMVADNPEPNYRPDGREPAFASDTTERGPVL